MFFFGHAWQCGCAAVWGRGPHSPHTRAREISRPSIAAAGRPDPRAAFSALSSSANAVSLQCQSIPADAVHAVPGFPTVARDIVTVIARIGLGAIVIAHGWQKFNEWTVAGAAESFSQMGVPLPDLAAPFSTFVELIGGALLILGALTPLVGA